MHYHTIVQIWIFRQMVLICSTEVFNIVVPSKCTPRLLLCRSYSVCISPWKYSIFCPLMTAFLVGTLNRRCFATLSIILRFAFCSLVISADSAAWSYTCKIYKCMYCIRVRLIWSYTLPVFNVTISCSRQMWMTSENCMTDTVGTLPQFYGWSQHII